ncbi:VOC family protein [Sphingobium sp.]|uniref:VOC family protein n=1 Tax=Sphingobium sp. TaxID=1912891 RepID=UPI002E1D46D7
MAILGIETLIYGVDDVALSRRFFEDFGLAIEHATEAEARFRLPEGSAVVIRSLADPDLPPSPIEGAGVRQVIWGVDSEQALDALAADLSRDCDVRRSDDGTVHFQAGFGIPMGLRLFRKRPVLCAPEPANAPGRTERLNRPRRWRTRAYPKGLSHVVFAVPDFESGTAFMRDRLGFRLSDEQVGFGMYLRADGSNNHHNFLLLNATAPLPGMDGKLRFHHANFAVEDLDEIMIGANHMDRRGWEPSHAGLGRHRIDSALFYYLPCPAGGEAEYGADSDCVDDGWVPRRWPEPLFAYAHFVHNLPPFLRQPPRWKIDYMTDPIEVLPPHEGKH